jgi:hypothetical protein
MRLASCWSAGDHHHCSVPEVFARVVLHQLTTDAAGLAYVHARSSGSDSLPITWPSPTCCAGRLDELPAGCVWNFNHANNVVRLATRMPRGSPRGGIFDEPCGGHYLPHESFNPTAKLTNTGFLLHDPPVRYKIPVLFKLELAITLV